MLKAHEEATNFKQKVDLYEHYNSLALMIQQDIANEVRPSVKYYIELGKYEEAKRFISKHMPDCSSKVIMFKLVLDAEKKERE